MKAGSAEFGIHSGNNTLVRETVVPILVHADNQVFVYLDTDYGCRPDNLPSHGDVLGRGFDVVGRMVVAQNHGGRIGQDGGLENFTRVDRSG
jgi:hypothetical protein